MERLKSFAFLCKNSVKFLREKGREGTIVYYDLCMVLCGSILISSYVLFDLNVQNDEFSLLWMVANLRSNTGLSSDILNGQEVYTYIYMYIYTHIRTYAHTHIHIYTHTHTHIHFYITYLEAKSFLLSFDYFISHLLNCSTLHSLQLSIH